MGGVYAAIFLAAGIFLPYFPLFLDGLGFGATEIGLILGVPLAARLVSGIALGALADIYRDRPAILALYALVAAAFCVGFLTINGGWPIFALMVLFAVFWTALVPTADAIAVDITRRTRAQYGRIRAPGSVAFIAANLAGGFAIAAWGAGIVPVLIAGALILTAVAAMRLRSLETRSRTEAAIERPKFTVRWASPAFLAGLLAAALIQGSHAVFYVRGSLHWQELNFSGGFIGLLWSAGVASEVLLFICANRFVGPVGPRVLIAIGGAAAVVRWCVFPMIESPSLSLALQLLHGVTFGATYLGMIAWIQRHAPSDWLASAQSMAATMIAVTMAVLTFSSGPLLAAFGIHAIWLGAVAAALGLVLSLLLSAPRCAGDSD